VPKSKYQSHIAPNLLKIEAWKREGVVENTMCKRLGVGHNAFNKYKNTHEDLREALKKGEIQLVECLEKSLFQRAAGYSYEETRTTVKNGVECVDVSVKHMAPDVTALIYSLGNLAPEKWKNNRYSNPDTLAIDRERLELEKQRFEMEKSKLPENQDVQETLAPYVAALSLAADEVWKDDNELKESVSL
jgi:hypothetical protein